MSSKVFQGLVDLRWDFPHTRAIVLAQRQFGCCEWALREAGALHVALSPGNLLPVAMQTAEKLGESGLPTGVVSFHTVKPLDEHALAQAFSTAAVVATIEEHSLIGGLGSAVAEWLSDQAEPAARLVRIGTADRFLHEAGGQSYARQCYGLDTESICTKIRDLLP